MSARLTGGSIGPEAANQLKFNDSTNTGLLQRKTGNHSRTTEAASTNATKMKVGYRGMLNGREEEVSADLQ